LPSHLLYFHLLSFFLNHGLEILFCYEHLEAFKIMTLLETWFMFSRDFFPSYGKEGLSELFDK
jgi:hypothetical protein